MKQTNEVSKKRLFISELERPLPATAAEFTTMMVGEESLKGGDPITTLALGEECLKG